MDNFIIFLAYIFTIFRKYCVPLQQITNEMTKTVLSITYLFCSLAASAASDDKTIYVPEDLRSIDLQSDTSRWSMKRCLETEDLIFMWERGFGNDVSNPLQLEGHGYQHLVNFDFTHAYKETRQYACTFNTKLENTSDGWLRPEFLPEGYGFNAIKLDSCVNLKSPTFHLRIRGDQLRYGFVGITTDGESIYSDVNATSFTSEGKPLKHLYLIVMGAPKHHSDVMTDDNVPKYKQYPYEFQISNS